MAERIIGAEEAVGGPLIVDEDEIDRTPVRTYWQLVRRRFVRHRLAVVGAVVLAILLAMAILVPLIAGVTWQRQDVTRSGLPPEVLSANGTPTLALFGYDRVGYNVFARLMAAAGTSLLIGFAAVSIIVGIGVTIGSIAGFAGGWVDNVLMRFVDIVLSLPYLFIIVAIVAFWGGGSIWTVIIAIGITGWTLAARLVRAAFLSLREVDYVQAARALGAPPQRIILRHMLPPAIAPIIVAASLGVADSVVIEAALSFLGFGVDLNTASLGTLLTNAEDYFNREPIRVVYPGVVLVLIVLSANFLGDGLRDALDPRQRVETR
jgi:peptide/nickel transport system permease protein